MHFTIGIDCFERSEIGAAFVDSYRFGHAVPGERLLEVTPGRTLVPMGAQQKVNSIAVLVNGTAEMRETSLPSEVTLLVLQQRRKKSAV